MKLGGNRPLGDNPILFSISGTGSLVWFGLLGFNASATARVIARDLLCAQWHRHGCTYQGLWLPSRGALGETEMFRPGRTRIDNTSAHSRTRYLLTHPGSEGLCKPRTTSFFVQHVCYLLSVWKTNIPTIHYIRSTSVSRPTLPHKMAYIFEFLSPLYNVVA